MMIEVVGPTCMTHIHSQMLNTPLAIRYRYVVREIEREKSVSEIELNTAAVNKYNAHTSE